MKRKNIVLMIGIFICICGLLLLWLQLHKSSFSSPDITPNATTDTLNEYKENEKQPINTSKDSKIRFPRSSISKNTDRRADNEKYINNTSKDVISSDKTDRSNVEVLNKRRDMSSLPTKLLQPLHKVRLSKRKFSTLCKDDLKTLDYINRKRIEAALKKLHTLPTGLNDQECLLLLNGQLIEEGKPPLSVMPTGLKMPKNFKPYDNIRGK